MARVPTRWWLAAALSMYLAAWPVSASADDPSFVVIASPGVTEHHLSRETLRRIFTRKQALWPSGVHIQPVNLPADHPLRRAFSQSILGGPPQAFEDYWRDMYFHGVLPPHVLASEEAVLLFVATTPGAIGYVSSCPGNLKLSIVLVVGDVLDCAR
ncbi:ABC transporter substrate-binding protein [soil metagenome]